MNEYDYEEDFEESDEEEEPQDTAGYICELCDFLEESDDVLAQKSEITGSLEILEEDFDFLEAEYKKPAPKGGKAFNTVMLDILGLYKQSLEQIYLYLEEPEKDKLKKSRESAMKAAELVGFLRNSIARRRLEMAEILSKFESGEMKEGQPITEQEEEFSLKEHDSVIGKLRSIPKARDTAFLEDRA
ncbi:MAG: hypothetical protein LWY06_12120 [Firmicutes bacterium]|nr:hypothetical protein [Bacillota bacterium]